MRLLAGPALLVPEPCGNDGGTFGRPRSSEAPHQSHPYNRDDNDISRGYSDNAGQKMIDNLGKMEFNTDLTASICWTPALVRAEQSNTPTEAHEQSESSPELQGSRGSLTAQPQV